MHAENSPLPEPASPTPEQPPRERTLDEQIRDFYFSQESEMAKDQSVPFPRPASPPSSPTELTARLDRFHIVCQQINMTPELLRNQVTGSAMTLRYTRARAAVESLVEARDKEIAGLRFNLKSYYADLTRNSNELSALRQQSLSPEEARAIVMDVDGEGLEDFNYAAWESGRVKLRALSSKGQK